MLPEGFGTGNLEEMRRMYQEGLLRPIDYKKIVADDGVILTTCSDGRCFPNLYGYFNLQVSTDHVGNGHPIIHPVALAGTVPCIPKSSPIFPHLSDDELIMWNFEFAYKKLGITTVLLCHHWPCGAVLESGVSFDESMRLFARAKLRVRRAFKKMVIGSFLDLNFGRDNFGRDCQSTYQIPMRNLRAYLKMNRD